MKNGDIVRLQNVGFSNATVNELTAANQHICFYDASKALINGQNAGNTAPSPVFGSEGNITQFTVQHSTVGYSGVAYFRLNGHYLDDDSIITVNDEIAETTETVYQWANTGHAYISADYEDRIIASENTAEDHGAQLASVEQCAGNGTASSEIPSYVQAEAEQVAQNVQSVRTGQCFLATLHGLALAIPQSRDVQSRLDGE